MKKFDLVRLNNTEASLSTDINKNMRGVVLEIILNYANIMFFNPKKVGDYKILKIAQKDLVVENEKLPDSLKQELATKVSNLEPKTEFDVNPFKAYNMVELTVEKDAYTQFGINKGDKGCVMENKIVGNSIEVDFSYIDDNGKFCGDCISVDINDIKFIK